VMPRNDQFRSEYAECAGYEIHYMDWGETDAPPVVMWHGLARTGRDFDMLCAELSTEYRCICPDMIGRGLSQWAHDPDVDYCFEMYGEIAVALLDHLGLKNVRWVGTSMGGLIGIHLASQSLKERISHLVLNDVGPEIPVDAITRIVEYVGNPPIFDRMSELEQWFRTIYAPFGNNSDAWWRQLTETSVRRLRNGQIMAHYDPKIVTQFTGPDGAQDLWSAFEAISCPILAIRGQESDVLTRAGAEQMTLRNPRCKVAEFEGYGHAPTLNTGPLMSRIRSFLAMV
jgi:pimeloyl-ACP methyl ester carboxylesterase